VFLRDCDFPGAAINDLLARQADRAQGPLVCRPSCSELRAARANAFAAGKQLGEAHRFHEVSAIVAGAPARTARALRRWRLGVQRSRGWAWGCALPGAERAQATQPSTFARAAASPLFVGPHSRAFRSRARDAAAVRCALCDSVPTRWGRAANVPLHSLKEPGS
jgi:hypothetical protein